MNVTYIYKLMFEHDVNLRCLATTSWDQHETRTKKLKITVKGIPLQDKGRQWHMQIELCKTTKEKRYSYVRSSFATFVFFFFFAKCRRDSGLITFKIIHILLLTSWSDFELPVIEGLTCFQIKNRESCSMFFNSSFSFSRQKKSWT